MDIMKLSADDLIKLADKKRELESLDNDLGELTAKRNILLADIGAITGAPVVDDDPIDLVPTDKPKRGRRKVRAAKTEKRVRKPSKAERKLPGKKAEKPAGERKPRVSTDDNATTVRTALRSSGEPATMAQLVEKTGLTAVQIRRAVAMEGSGITTTGAKRGTRYALD